MSDSKSGVRNVPPKATALIEALRGLGYSAATALADLIDNSITAGADRVDLKFQWSNAESVIAILDNGHGMSDSELVSAMRLGERNPLEFRAGHDLGRFGMGLKTASFSQCRRFTVASRRSNEAVVSLRWDLDALIQLGGNEWRLFEGPATGSEHHLQPLFESAQGTLVLWELPDRLIPAGFTEQDFLDLIDKVEHHLGMVFHRYLDGTAGKLELWINGKKVRPWDPYLECHPATQVLPPISHSWNSHVLNIQGYVLPHKDKLTTRQFEEAAGPHGWTAQQGFYVYRNNRLLVAGSWLGLGPGRSWTKEEAHRLARIRLDITNSADAEWKIDIRKSTARPPAEIRSFLARIAEDVRKRARRVFAHRGNITHRKNSEISFVWRADHRDSDIRYRIDHEHPAVKTVLNDAGPLLPQIKAMLRVIEETVPVQRIWLDTVEARETPRTGFAGSPTHEISSILNVLYRNLIDRNGMDPESARLHLLGTEPFNNHPELVAALPDNPNRK